MLNVRLRRLRERKSIRDWISQIQLSIKDFILPYFVVEGRNIKKEVKSLAGVYQLSVDNLLRDVEESMNLGIKSILLFGIPKIKDEFGSEAYKRNGIVQKAIKALKKRFKEQLILITDICLCGYTSHGHCGLIKIDGSKSKNYSIDNDHTLKVLSRISVSHAEAGVDFVAPSAMMDGQVKIIRESLDNEGFKDVGILAYSAKYASSFYGPFREIMGSAPRFGDRKSYQLDYRNVDLALREIAQDINEGADMVMVKPALAYLDIILRVKQRFHIPIAAYNVSGEYYLIKNSLRPVEEKEIVLEILTALKRAGADLIITYWAKDIARWLEKI